MEKELKIPLGQNKVAYGTLFGDLKNPLIIFVHGFTGHKDEHIFFNGARFFEKNGYSSFRFNLYGDANDARKLNDSPLSQNAEDLDIVIDFFNKKGVNKIYVVGHSYGGLVILLSKYQKFDKACLWDPSYNPNGITDEAEYLKEKDLYYFDKWEFAFTIGKKMYEENKTINPEELIKKIKVPVKIILAGNGRLKNYWRNQKNSIIIPGATHTFSEYGTEEKLFEETLNWIKE